MRSAGVRHGRAVAVVCALGVLAVPAGTAHADPGEKSSGTSDLEEMRRRIDALHEDVEKAAERYKGAEEKVERQQKEIISLAKRIDRLRGRQQDMRERAGAMARAQYRGGGMPEEARMVLGGDPEAFLDRAARLRQGGKAAHGFLADLEKTRTRLAGYAEQATGRWEVLEKNRKTQQRARKRIEKRLATAERAESRLADDERRKLRSLEEKASRGRQAKWLKSGILDDIDGKASKAGRKAIAFATNQIGKDYEWGAEGPGTFDCSGLTLRAWEAAGVQIPRTSQEQWKQLDRVPVGSMRPGDLIIFRQDAGHVGMYVGDGAMVHAPRTGRQITIEGAGSLPILGVVRPDK